MLANKHRENFHFKCFKEALEVGEGKALDSVKYFFFGGKLSALVVCVYL